MAVPFHTDSNVSNTDFCSLLLDCIRGNAAVFCFLTLSLLALSKVVMGTTQQQVLSTASLCNEESYLYPIQPGFLSLPHRSPPDEH